MKARFGSIFGKLFRGPEAFRLAIETCVPILPSHSLTHPPQQQQRDVRNVLIECYRQAPAAAAPNGIVVKINEKLSIKSYVSFAISNSHAKPRQVKPSSASLVV